MQMQTDSSRQIQTEVDEEQIQADRQMQVDSGRHIRTEVAEEHIFQANKCKQTDSGRNSDRC
ncbi:hypothetical protein Tco_0313628, partial [Tanacetum coccineum]